MNGEHVNPGSEQPGPQTGRRARRRAEIRARLIDAGRHVFTRHGLDDATIAQITEAADVGFGTFYLYFPTKEALYRAVVFTGIRSLGEQLQSLRPDADSAWRNALQAGVETVFLYAASNRDLFLLMFAGREHGGAAPGRARGGAAVGGELRGPLVEWVGAIVQAAIRAECPGEEHALEELVEILTAGAVAVLRRTTFWWARNVDDVDMDTTLTAAEAGGRVGRFISGGLAAALGAEPLKRE